VPFPKQDYLGWKFDGCWRLDKDKENVPIGQKSKANDWLYSTPFGLRKI
jgi:hypothetical protein